MTEYVVDPVVWFAVRALDFAPVHFIHTTTPVTSESIQWVMNNLRGRYAIMNSYTDLFSQHSILGKIAFEDPSEAVMYELRWS
jgi:hypothetical protein